MIIGLLKERYPDEKRVALIPAGVSKLIDQGFKVVIETNAGIDAGYQDKDYIEAGATLYKTASEVLNEAKVVVKVRYPLDSSQIEAGIIDQSQSETERFKQGQSLICMLDPWFNLPLVKELAAKQINAFALEFIPRITRAQSMDVLSSMAAMSGYRAVLSGSVELPKYFPMLMTAAGTVRPAKVFIIGAGVAGLMAISTARRLGAVVEAYDTRIEAKEQVESLGATFVEFDLPAEDSTESGGYAKEKSKEFYEAQRQQMTQYVSQADLVITTAAIPGKPSPRLISKEMVQQMKPGSVIVDLAAERGGNVEGTVKNEKTKVALQSDHPGQQAYVTLIGYIDHPSRMAEHASMLLSNNITAYISNLLTEGEIDFDKDDEIVQQTKIVYQGEVVHEGIKAALETNEKIDQ